MQLKPDADFTFCIFICKRTKKPIILFPLIHRLQTGKSFFLGFEQKLILGPLPAENIITTNSIQANKFDWLLEIGDVFMDKPSSNTMKIFQVLHQILTA